MKCFTVRRTLIRDWKFSTENFQTTVFGQKRDVPWNPSIHHVGPLVSNSVGAILKRNFSVCNLNWGAILPMRGEVLQFVEERGKVNDYAISDYASGVRVNQSWNMNLYQLFYQLEGQFISRNPRSCIHGLVRYPTVEGGTCKYFPQPVWGSQSSKAQVNEIHEFLTNRIYQL